VSPLRIQSLFQMGTLLERTGDPKGALDEFRAAIQSDQAGDQPGRASAYYRAARLCKKLGYADEATQDFKKFTEIHDAHHHVSHNVVTIRRLWSCSTPGAMICPCGLAPEFNA
jgi:hypothetical protein